MGMGTEGGWEESCQWKEAVGWLGSMVPEDRGSCPTFPGCGDDDGSLSLSDELLLQFPRMMTQSGPLCSCLGLGG